MDQHSNNEELSFDDSLNESDDHYEINRKTEVAIAKMICGTLEPVTFVDEPGFKEFLKFLNPIATLESSAVFSERVIPELYQDVFYDIKEELQKAGSVSISIDEYSTKRGKKYPICVTAHFVCSDTVRPKYYILETVFKQDFERVSSIGEIVSECLSKFGIPIENVQMITSSEGNMHDLDNNIPVFTSFEPVLQLAINEGIKHVMPDDLLFNLITIKNEIKKVPSKWRGISNSLKDLEVPMSLIDKNSDSWVNLYLMLECFLRKKDAVTIFLFRHNNLPKLTPSDWQHVNLCRELLQPLFGAIKRIASNSPTIPLSMVIPFCRVLSVAPKNEELVTASQIIYQRVHTFMDEQLKNENVQKCMHFATLTDPRFKDKFFEKSKENFLIDECVKILTVEEMAKDSAAKPKKTESIFDFLCDEIEPSPPEVRAANTAKYEVKLYLNTRRVPSASPYEFWSTPHSTYAFSAIRKLALKYIAIPAYVEKTKKHRLSSFQFRRNYPQLDLQKKVAFLHMNLPLLKNEHD